MTRFLPFVSVVLLAVPTVALAVLVSPWWLVAAVPLLGLTGVGVFDVVQKRHAVLRQYPLTGHGRWIAEELRPEIHQYFVESDTAGRPFHRDQRSLVYERAKGGAEGTAPFGTELDMEAVGREYVTHSLAPIRAPEEVPRVRLGGPHCTKPYEMALLNVSAMSFGALSPHAILALNGGAARGGFAHDTGEGGISKYHRAPGGDLIWEIGSGYFGCRTEDGRFDEERYAQQACDDQVKATHLKLSQGAKPGLGGLLPGSKVTPEIARTREVPEGQTVESPPFHTAFSTPRELVKLCDRMRELSGGKPVGFKLCVGRRSEFLAVCKAMVQEGSGPDFITVDGSEGGTGAAPLEFEDSVGRPLTEGLLFVHNALVGTGLRDRVTLGVSGKIVSGADMVRRIALGADYCNSARAMMMATGCIQAQRCHTNECPVGVATTDPRRYRALDVADKTTRVANYQHATVRSAQRIMAAMGLTETSELRPHHVRHQVGGVASMTWTDLYDWLEPGVLLQDAPEPWTAVWNAADPDTFHPDVRILD